jgi:predicted nucleic acid-binding protein
LTEWRLRYAERTIAFGGSAALHYGSILVIAETGGRAMSFPDAQIAAIAMEHDCALATRNIRDFVTTKLKLINPWE